MDCVYVYKAAHSEYLHLLVNTVHHIFLTILYFSDLETHQNLTSINFGEQR